jgi:altronate hydrolase
MEKELASERLTDAGRQAYLKIHSADNVLVALKDLPAGTFITENRTPITLIDLIPAKHKFFIEDMKAGDDVIMYGVLVGKVQCPVKSGQVMTTANTKHAASKYAYRAKQYNWQPPDVSQFANKTFKGYKRKDGRVGTANYWLFIPTVFCENRNLDVIKEAMWNELGYAVTDKYKQFTRQLFAAYRSGENIDAIDLNPTSSNTTERYFKNVDGIKFLNHAGGCGGTRQDSATLSALLASYADHPNVAGVTVLSLGCQHLQVKNFLTDLKKRNPSFDKPLYVFEQQNIQSEEELIAEAIRQTFKGLVEINKQEREDVALNNLCIGVKCGGSDGFSGISANPAIGYTSDLLVALGGKILLAEFPELCGAEQDLIDRCNNEEAANKFINLMETYDRQAQMVGSGFHMNPSPGNIKDGLITDAIKSTGAARKGGTSPVVSVLDYTEPAILPGLSLVCTPGNDVEATTGKAASGATLILFTTGLGTPTGNPVAPTIKLATNSNLAKRMNDIIDIDTGPIISGEKTIQQMGEEILDFCIKVASGELIPKAVQLAQDDFIPWKRGVSL